MMKVMPIPMCPPAELKETVSADEIMNTVKEKERRATMKKRSGH